MTLELEKGREDQFRYRVAGEAWHNDWYTDQYAANPLSGAKSVVVT